MSSSTQETQKVEKKQQGATRSRAELLLWLRPGLDPAVARTAGDLLDPVSDYLERQGPTRLLDDPPVLTFDPISASSYLPPPFELGGEPEDWSSKEVDLEWLDPQDIARLVSSRRLQVRDIVDVFRKRIELWGELNAFTTTTLSEPPDLSSPAGPLAGAPIGVQDMIATAGVLTTAGSRVLGDFVPRASAVCWERLHDSGALLAGKLSTQEFAAGTTGVNDWFGAVRNPWELTRTAGGAAGGAGAALAAGLISAALATDPGGSIRVPAALCGVIALKPTYGTVDRRGSIPLTWTTETIGVLARTVRGAARVADLVLDGRSRERWGLGCEAAANRGANARLGIRVGVPENWLGMGLDPDVAQSYRDALDVLVELGAELVEVRPPSIDDIAPTHRAIAFAEASTIHEDIIERAADQYGDAIRGRQEAGRGVLASEYLKANRIRGHFTRAFSELWRETDVFAVPTSPVPAAKVGTRSLVTHRSRGAEATHSVYTRYSAPMSTLGLPAVSVPCGFSRDGLPLGIQLSGPPYSEPLLMHAAAAYQSSTSWHLLHPSLVPTKEVA